MANSLVIRLAICASLLVDTLGLQDIISDLTGGSGDQSRALEIKAEKFWRSVLDAAHAMRMEEHVALYQDVEKVIAALPSENSYVREALSEALMRLQRADSTVLSQSVQSSGIAEERLEAGAGAGTGGFSLLTGGVSWRNAFAQALRHFVDGGKYSERLMQHIKGRQADILPSLQGTAAITGDVLTDCRLASKRSFDALKYDLYTKGAPKTPKAAKDIAHRLVKAASATRHRFTQFVIGSVTSITQDHEGKNERAEATVLRSSLEQTSSRIPRPFLSSGSDQIFNL